MLSWPPKGSGVVNNHIEGKEDNMSLDISALDSHIERLRKGETLTENEVRALCEKVRATHRGSLGGVRGAMGPA